MSSLANLSQLKLAILIGIFISIFAPANLSAQKQNLDANGPMLLELFTSRYCPACPKADQNFNALIDENHNIIGLSCHVTYFNRASRKDKLSYPFCDARQNIYKLTLKTGGVFTPFMVLNGQDFNTGIKSTHIRAIENKARNTTNQLVGLEQKGRYLDISLPQMQLDKVASVWLFEIKKYGTISGYEHYRNSVMDITKLMNWSGKPIEMAFPVKNPDPNINYVVIVQNFKGGVIASGQSNP